MTGERAHAIRRDAALMRRLADGDADAARAIVHAHARPTARFAAHLLKDAMEAEDVANEAVMRLWKIADEWRANGTISGWLRRSAYTQCIDRLRRTGRLIETEDDNAVQAAAAPDPSPEANAFGAEIGAAIDGALNALPERQKAAITLATYDGLNGAEIAEALDVSAEAVESLLARARRSLRKALRPIYQETTSATVVSNNPAQ